MCRLVETIRAENGKLMNISYHNDRVMRTLYDIYGLKSGIDLENSIVIPPFALHGIYKCRVLYDNKSIEIEFLKYAISHVRSLKLVYDDSINYSYKYANRENIDKLMQLREKCDDILIIKNGMVTDSSYANVIFLDKNGVWYTPASYLLPGTMRASLLKKRQISETEIRMTDIKKYTELRLINAMRDIESSAGVPVSHIFGP